ncbi:hypothetical protein Hanom_Chr15g01388971 [Helianthus anomalus]
MNEDQWQRKFFFVKKDSINKGFDLPVRWLTSGRISGFRDIPKYILTLYP